MRHARFGLALLPVLILGLLAAIGGFPGTGARAAVPGAPPTFSSPLDFTNPYFPFEPGGVKVSAGRGDGGKISVVDSYLEETRDFTWGGGTVTCRVLREMEFEGGRLAETSWNYFAQADDGSVRYFGEIVDVFEDGVVVSHEGSWLVGGPGPEDPPETLAATGPTLFMPANPEAGDEFRPEDVPGGPQETDLIRRTGKKVKVPAGRFGDCIEVLERSSPGGETETKWYAPGVGHVRTKAKGENLKLVARTFLGILERAYEPDIDPRDFSTTIDNEYLPLAPGTTFVLEGESEDGSERNEVNVLAETREVFGVACVVVRDRVWVDGVLAEETFDWFAQDGEGNVWYFGEDSREYDRKGEVVSTEGSWEAGVDGAQPGIVMPGDPRVGQIYRQEYLEGEAEDLGQVLGLTETVTVPFGTFENCLRTKDWTPLEPKILENKYFARGVGVLLEVTVAGGKDRMELVEVRKE